MCHSFAGEAADAAAVTFKWRLSCHGIWSRCPWMFFSHELEDHFPQPESKVRTRECVQRRCLWIKAGKVEKRNSAAPTGPVIEKSNRPREHNPCHLKRVGQRIPNPFVVLEGLWGSLGYVSHLMQATDVNLLTQRLNSSRHLIAMDGKLCVEVQQASGLCNSDAWTQWANWPIRTASIAHMSSSRTLFYARLYTFI